MIEYVANEFAKIVSKTIKRFAEELKVSEYEIQVYFGLDAAKENVYKIMHNYQPYKTVGFLKNGILKEGIDFTGKSNFVPPALVQILEELAKENGIVITDVGVMVIRKDTDDHLPVVFYLYNGTHPVKPLKFEEIFSKIKME